MGKFDGILLCSDLDGTLFTKDRQVSSENQAAIRYFIGEGGRFTFATGRGLGTLNQVLAKITPNAPLICYNGSGIYDPATDQLIWETKLDHNAGAVLDFVTQNFASAGIEICLSHDVVFCRENRYTQIYRRNEGISSDVVNHQNVTEPWRKVVFMVEEEEMASFQALINSSPFAGQYDFIRSSRHFYEMLPKGASKGAALDVLASHLGILPENTIGVGDHENDISLLQHAGIGVAVANAQPILLDLADFITADHDNHAIAAVIYGLEQGKILKIR